MSLFRRKYELTVDAVKVTELDVSFEVHRSLKPEPNKGTFRIYNLSPDRRGELEKNRNALGQVTEPLRLLFSAGYADGISAIFSGDVQTIESKRDGADWVTTIACQDGANSSRGAQVSRSFSAGTAVKDVLKHVADSMGIGKGNLDKVIDKIKIPGLGDSFPGGATVHGNSHEEFDRLIKSAGKTWSIQDGQLQVKDEEAAVSSTAIKLTPDSGLIGSPEVAKLAKPDSKQPALVTVTTLLIPGMVPGREVRLESADLKGSYQIYEAEHKGDRVGEDWGATLKLRPLNG